MITMLTEGTMMTLHRAGRVLAVALLLGTMNAPAAAGVQESAGPIAISPAPAPSDDGRVFVHGVRRQDEIVVVNVRPLCGGCDPDSLRTALRVDTYAIHHNGGNRRWQSSDLESFLAFDASVATIIYVHGNQLTASDAKCEGLAVYRRLMHYGADGPPIRFVIFSWPSARVGGLLRDVRVKAGRTDPAGCQLGWLLDQMPAETPVTLVGFSYGARIITGGLHILAGGNLGRLALQERAHPNRAPVNVVLMATASHAHWLCERQYHGLALSQVNRMLLLNNCRDPAMRFYHLAFRGRRGCPQALGLRGPTCTPRHERSKIQMQDLSRYGSRHSPFLYLCAPSVPGQIWEYAIEAPGSVQLQAAK